MFRPIKGTTVARAVITAAPMATLALMAAFAATPAFASTVVDPNATPCVTATTHYTTIQAAVTAATSGETIQVCPGNYAEQVTITTPLTLKGVTNTTGNTGASVVTIPGNTFSGAYTQITINAENVTLTDIGVDGTNSLSSCSGSLTGILFDSGSSGTLKNVALRNQNISNGTGGYCGSGSPISANGASTVTVTDSSVRNFDASGISLTTTGTATVKTTTVAPIVAGSSNCIYANAPTLVVSNNTVADCYTGVYVTSTVQATVSGNTVHGGLNSVAGIFCFPVCTGQTVSGNLIFDTYTGFSIKTSGEVGGVTFENNDINGTTNAVYLFLETGNTISNNTITDAQVGIAGVSGNTVSGNTFRAVTTLTQ